MSFDIKKHKDDLLLIPLGGANRVGTNMSVYHYKGKFLIVDCGCGFADDSLPGIDILVPDISFLMQHKESIIGIVITHAHEDHIGALRYLWHELECDIYATPFVSVLLTERFLENRYKLPADIIPIDLDKPRFNLGPFDIELVHMCHSIPEMHSILLRTPAGNIFHTGDWKYDAAPLVGPTNDNDRFQKLGEEGILAIIGDSTNVFNQGSSGSEGELRKSLIDLVKASKQLVVVTLFSSNIARMESIIEAAIQSKRKIVLSGQNLRRIVKAGLDSGYFKNMNEVDFIEEKNISKYDRNKLLVIATGCQGEQFASVTKMSTCEHRFIKLNPGDTVIFSSKIIPGNDARIYRLFDRLVSLGVELIMEATDFTHVSGHPGQKELKQLYDLLQPKALIPIHGEQIHLYYHRRLAKSWGINKTLLLSDGDVIKFSNTESSVARKIGEVHAKELAVYGTEFFEYDSPVMKERRKLSSDGACMIFIALSAKGLASDPIIKLPGYLDETQEAEFIEYVKDEITVLIENALDRGRKKSANFAELEKAIKAHVKSLLKHEIERAPQIYIAIVRTD